MKIECGVYIDLEKYLMQLIISYYLNNLANMELRDTANDWYRSHLHTCEIEHNVSPLMASIHNADIQHLVFIKVES